jgi:integrase
MKNTFWLCQRGPVFYLLEVETGRRTSLRTTDRAAAEQFLRAKNEVAGKSALALALGRAYFSAYNPKLTQRTWQAVVDEYCSRRQPQTQAMRRRKTRHKAFDLIRHQPLLETAVGGFLAVLQSSGVSVAACLRGIHNLALGLGWLPWPVLAPQLWPPLRYKPKRGITSEEHEQILAAERNLERRLYYALLWEIGASQTDGALLTAENVDWETGTLSYRRQKNGSLACLSMGPRLEALLRSLPVEGPLFPRISATPANARAAEFYRRCKLLGISEVSLHSCRYSWAEHAKQCGYPERFAQEALGHNSKAVHRAYARKAKMELPPLEDYERAQLGPQPPLVSPEKRILPLFAQMG